VEKAAQVDNPQLQETINKYYPYFMEIRKRLLFIVSIFLIFAFLGFLFYEPIILKISAFLSVPGVNVVFTSPFQFLELGINSAVFIGATATIPLVIYQILSFIRPALSKQEYKSLFFILPISIFLFLFGFGYGLVMMRYVITLFYEKSVALNIGNILDISQLLSKILATSTLMGIGFQFPIILTLLMRLRIVKYKAVKKQRFLAWMGAIFFAAFLPPTDLMSLALLTLPLVILFETTLILNRVFKTHMI
jgi:sec-independent protein translocase protein TatC